jgi:putative methionine-R-sulfoxide reductase with GAF domain
MDRSLYQSLTQEREDLRAVNTVPMMNIISHQIERQIIENRIPAVVYAGFQRFSTFIPQMQIYRALGAAAKKVYVFGVPNVRLIALPGVEYIELKDDSPLAREWFLVVDTPEFWTTLSTEEIPGTDGATGGRKYRGVWTFDMAAVEQASRLIAPVAKQVYEEIPTRNYPAQNNRIGDININLMARLDGVQIVKRRSWIHSLTVQKVMESVTELEDIEELFEKTADTLTTFFGADNVAVVRTTEDRKYKLAAGNLPRNTQSYPFEQGLIGRALALNVPINVNDMEKNGDIEMLLPQARAIIIAPIIGRNGVYGALCVGANTPGQFTTTDAQTIISIANMLGLAIENPANQRVQLLRAKSLLM